MTDYFNGVDSKPSIKSDLKFTNEGARADLLYDYYVNTERKKVITPAVEETINLMFVKWTKLLFCGFNLAITGPLSKFALLETYRIKYLESGKLPDFTCNQYHPTANKKKRKKTEPDGYLNVHTVNIHGMEPLKLATFEHAMFNIKDQRKSTGKDYEEFVSAARDENKHYVFVIHSFELFQRDSNDVYDVILKLYSLEQKYIHMILTSDCFNGSKRLNMIKFRTQLLFFTAPYVESFFMEKSQLAGQFDVQNKGSTVNHRLFNDCVDLQSLIDLYQALGPTQAIMFYIIENFVQKSQLNMERATAGDKTLPVVLSKDEDGPRNRRITAKRGQSRIVKQVETDLDFHDLLRWSESNLFIRRGATLDQHLGELKDHKIISNDETHNKIQCIVNLQTCKRFVEYVESQRS